MQALYFLKFRRPNTSSPSSFTATQKEGLTEASTTTMVGDLEEEDDSFFELELTSTPTPTPSSDWDNNPMNIKYNNDPEEMCSYRFEFEPNHSFKNITKTKILGDNSKRKILPIEPISKPQSSISLLKSAPKRKVLTFKKCRSTVEREETGEKKLFEVSVKPIFTRDNSLRKHILEDPLLASSNTELELEEEEECSKLGKYLKLIRPFYVKVSKKEKKVRDFSGKVSSSFGSPSPTSSPLTVDSKGKRFGKHKSQAPAAAVVGRRDDSLVLQNDGIQSAILHCKKSFNSTKDSSPIMTRFASGSFSRSTNQVVLPWTSNDGK